MAEAYSPYPNYTMVERRHWKKALGSGVVFLVGFILMAAGGGALGVVLGLAVMALPVVAGVLSKFWSVVEGLPPGQRAFVKTVAVLGAIIFSLGWIGYFLSKAFTPTWFD